MEHDEAQLITEGYSAALEEKRSTRSITGLEIIVRAGNLYDHFLQRLIQERNQLHGIVQQIPLLLQLGYKTGDHRTIMRFKLREAADPREILMFLKSRPDIMYKVLENERCIFSIGRYLPQISN